MRFVFVLSLAVAILAGCSDDEAPPADRDAGSASGGNPRDASLDAAATDATLEDASQRDAAPFDDAAVSTGDASADASPPEDASVDAAAAEDASMDAAPSDTGTNEGEEDAGSEDASTDPPPTEDTFSMRVVTTELEAPWEITWGPDSQLWITERTGGRVVRVDPATGEQSVALVVADAYQAWGQDGVLGLALDPRLGMEVGGDYVYLAYTYDAAGGGEPDERAKIVRFTYDAVSESLTSALTLIEGLPASGDHNSGRLVLGPDNHLYYTIGDQGHNQFDNICLEVRAQALPSQADIDDEDWSAYQGKVLRLALDGSIPTDNPMLAGARSHIYSYGHRNAQGIAFGPSGKLYAAEQGPKTDDEVNLISPGKNYGWPHVAGFRDEMAYEYGNWSASSPTPCSSLSFDDYVIPDSVPRAAESSWSHPDFTPPLRTFYTVASDYAFMDPACPTNEFICWPTVAPSSLEVYVAGSEGLPSWGTSLLMTSLKEGSVYRIALSESGEVAAGEPTVLFKTTNRYRDLAIAPDKRTFYVITDSFGATSGPTSGSTQVLEHRGAVLEFSFAPPP